MSGSWTRLMAKLFAGSACSVLLAALAGVRVVVSPSMPRGIYLARPVDGALARADTVAVCLPEQVAALARSRGYLGRGCSCPGRVQTLTKAILATEGDTVDVGPAGMSVSGRVLPNTAQRRADSAGRPLPAMAHGKHVVGRGEVWIGSTFDPRSFDSRYFGPLPRSAIVSRRHPLWTERRRSH
jgi:conjugative transfer signal peptidase TraF